MQIIFMLVIELFMLVNKFTKSYSDMDTSNWILANSRDHL